MFMGAMIVLAGIASVSHFDGSDFDERFVAFSDGIAPWPVASMVVWVGGEDHQRNAPEG